ncbi:unnamed protein product [Soboliphyme baturini]|uniref:Uncharacterized protein n=1 Tax=Soboliphyme baturini TaxID=241478 RepID=A0A183ITB4_9BILA|nr:unnamed protein product [Soboliphyme baturini]
MWLGSGDGLRYSMVFVQSQPMNKKNAQISSTNLRAPWTDWAPSGFSPSRRPRRLQVKCHSSTKLFEELLYPAQM